MNPILKFQGRLDKASRARRGIRGALDVLRPLGSATHLAEKIEFSQRWFDIISGYGEGALTVPTDKLVAISGVAELVEGRARHPYLAGL